MAPAKGPPPTPTTPTAACSSWRVPASPAELERDLVEMPEAMQSAGGHLTATGIERDHAVARDGRFLQERAGLAAQEEAERLGPQDGKDAEPVIGPGTT